MSKFMTFILTITVAREWSNVTMVYNVLTQKSFVMGIHNVMIVLTNHQNSARVSYTVTMHFLWGCLSIASLIFFPLFYTPFIVIFSQNQRLSFYCYYKLYPVFVHFAVDVYSVDWSWLKTTISQSTYLIQIPTEFSFMSLNDK